MSGVGVCIRDHHEEMLAIKSSPLPQGANNMAEAHALFDGLVFAKHGGFQNVQVEGDSMVIISACSKSEPQNWQLAYILQKIWQLLDSFEQVYISHTLHEGNALADYLANLGCDDLNIVSLNPVDIITKDNEMHRLILINKNLCKG